MSVSTSRSSADQRSSTTSSGTRPRLASSSAGCRRSISKPSSGCSWTRISSDSQLNRPARDPRQALRVARGASSLLGKPPEPPPRISGVRVKLHLLLVVGLAACVLPSAAGQASPVRRSANPVLFASVGTETGPEDFVISVEDASHQKLTNVPAGDYDVQIDDWATVHSFHLAGPAGDLIATGIPETSHTTQTITLTDGTYRYKCDAHPFSMKVQFTVGTSPPPPPPPRRGSLPRCFGSRGADRNTDCRRRVRHQGHRP